MYLVRIDLTLVVAGLLAFFSSLDAVDAQQSSADAMVVSASGRNQSAARAEAWRELKARWDDLRNFVNQLDDEQQIRWRTQLQLDELLQLLRDPAHDAQSLRLMASQFYQTSSGLEDIRFVTFRQALDDYCGLLASVADATDVDARTQLIETLLQSPQGRHETDVLGRHVDWLVATGRHPETVSRLKEEYGHPNLLVEVSRNYVDQQLRSARSEIDQWDSITTTILGARVFGPAHTQAELSVSIPVTDGPASVQVVLDGTIRSPNNTAVRDPAVVRSTGITQFQARTDVHWDGQEFSTHPVMVDASTRTAITAVEATARRRSIPGIAALRRRLISRIGTRQAMNLKGQGEREASRQAERRIAEQVSAQVATAISTINGQIGDSFRDPLTRLGMFPQIAFHSADRGLSIAASQRGPGGLVAPRQPDWGALEGDVGLSVHQSALNNFVRWQNGGAIWTDRDLAELQKQLIGENSYEFRIGLHRRWAIRCDYDSPFAAIITSDGINFRLRMATLLIDDQQFDDPFEITANYQISCPGGDLLLTRVGDVQQHWTGDRWPDEATRRQLESFLQQKFSGFFLEEVYLDGLNAPAGGNWTVLSKLHTSDVELRPGWLRLTFSH